MSSGTIDMQSLRFLRSAISSHLADFARTQAHNFKILDSVSPTSTTTRTSNSKQNHTLYVLDSSFNPPSKAHASLVKAALKSWRSKTPDDTPRVLFLLATVNADKKPKPADFEDRIVMMHLAAEDLRDSLAKQSDTQPPIIDIGVTKMPYFVDKAISIDESRYYSQHGTKTDVVPDIQQVHLTGFDTLLRIFTPKYYPDHDPPLSALGPFLRHHRVRATVRVDENSPSENLKDAQAGEGGLGTIEGQRRYLDGIKKGSMEEQGMKTEWGEQVELVVDESGEAQGVSSTRVRDAVKAGNWDDVGSLVGERVAEYIRLMGLYLEEKDGKL